MKRLEHIRTLRNCTSRLEAKTPQGAVTVLAQIAPEKRRLEHEKSNWGARIRKIEGRLKEIAQMEEQLLAVAGFKRSAAEEKEPAGPSSSLAPGFTEMTMRY
jgi:hypothetical protein